MENRDNQHTHSRNHGTPATSNGGLIIGGLLAAAVVMGVVFYAGDDRRDMNDISPAAGNETPANTNPDLPGKVDNR
ncbi:MAG: hypothetical protein ACAH80_17575 [Alphaproteobacteria bacterium]